MDDVEQTSHDDKAVLLAELQHRVRNTLNLMRAIVRRSAETSESLEEYVMHLEGRLAALARVQNAFLRNPTAGIDLGLMVSDELAAVDARESDRVRIEGPPIKLHPRAAEPIGLALHELAANALKFGALTKPSGQISVTWRLAEGEHGSPLIFDWTEMGAVLTDTSPARRGFGLTALEQMLPHTLKAKTTISFTPQGMRCEIALPATERVLVAS